MKNVAIYWWSFNPPTIWHFQALQAVFAKTDVERIIVTPSWIRLDKDHNVDPNNRKELIEAFIKVLRQSWLNVDFDFHFFEWKNGWVTSTLQEEKYFREKLWLSPTFIYGSDVIDSMHKWLWNDNLYIETKLKKIFLSRPWYEFHPEKFELDNYVFLDVPELMNVSSSIAREMVKNKQDVVNILHSEIIEVIEKNDLYSK